MALTYTTANRDDVDELCELDGRNFGFRFDGDSIERIRDSFELSRFVVARDSSVDGRPMVGAAGNFGLELTLPGPAVLPMAGVTWVSVSTTHRRRGIAARMMAWLDDDARSHGETVIGLTASEGGIYERFGYGVATVVRAVSIDRRRVEMLERFRAETSSVRFVDHNDHYPELCAIFDRYRRGAVGQVAMPEFLARENFGSSSSTTQVVCALHDDGFALWQVNPDWNDGDPRHGLRLWMLCGATDEARRALWTLILSTDLAGEITSRFAVGLDDPLPYFLTNPRAVKTTHVGDHLWLKVLNAKAAFAARSYRTDDALVLELPGGDKLRITADGVSTTRRKRADLIVSESAVGPLLLGGVSASRLFNGGRVEAASTTILERADAFFGSSPTPHCSVAF